MSWVRMGLMLFCVAVVARVMLEHRPEKLLAMVSIGAIGIAVVAMGWLFANRREL